MGSALRLPLARVPVLGDVIDALRTSGTRLVAAVPRGGLGPDEVSWQGRVALVIGGEGPGLPASVADGCDERVTIPMHAPVESLNVAVATAVLVYAARRQRS
jgi:tRNA G18 (ribose-2'-O)-methylase SpoU